MAKIALTKSQKLNTEISQRAKRLRHEIQDRNIKQKDLAELTGLSQQSISYQLKSGNISFLLLVAIEMLINE